MTSAVLLSAELGRSTGFRTNAENENAEAFRHWLRHAGPTRRFDLVPATLNQAKGALYLPLDPEGTQTRPYISIRPAAHRTGNAA